MDICEKFKAIKKDYKDFCWRGFLVVAKTDEEMFKAMKESGCYECATGIESMSPKILLNIRKPATVEQNMRFIHLAKKAGLRVKVFMIMGLPGEDWSTVRETDEALSLLKAEGCAPDDLDVSLLQVYKGSNIYRDSDKVDVEFEEDIDKAFYKSSPQSYESLVQVRTKGMSKMDLISARNYLESKFKPENWQKDHTGRMDYDRITETIRHAERKIKDS